MTVVRPDRLGTRTINVGALVLMAFVGPRPVGYECSHLNGNAGDNRPGNLAWETHAENMARSIEHGTAALVERGSARYNAKLAEGDVGEIRKLLATGARGVDIAAQFGVSPSQVSKIKHGKKWTHA